MTLLLPGVCAASETVWFGGTQRALPIGLAAPKEDGLHSNFVFTDDGHEMWDFNLGTDVSIWQRTSGTSFQSVGPRFGIASRFQFDSSSFDLWAADFRGGGVYGIRFERMAYEIFVFHESSHLGDEMPEHQGRRRIDYNVNGIRLTASQRWKDWLRTYGGVIGQPWTKPEKLSSFGFHAGVEFTSLPPVHRGFVAVDSECWEWRSWEPDVMVQLGVFVGPRGKGRTLEAARIYLELRSGCVMLGQFHDETEKYIALGLATNW